MVIDDSALINSPPFDWSKFLVDLRSTELLKSSEGVLVENAVAGAEFSLNIAFGGYKGVIQPKRIGKASVFHYLLIGLFNKYRFVSRIHFCGKFVAILL